MGVYESLEVSEGGVLRHQRRNLVDKVGGMVAEDMGGEDFAYYANQVPAAFIFLSSSNPEKGTDVPHHNPKFNVDEDVFWIGSALFVKIAEKFLGF